MTGQPSWDNHPGADDWLIPEEGLPLVEGELLERVSALGDIRLEMVMDRDAGRALAIALALEHWPELIAGSASDPLTRFYNRLYWFGRFAALWQLEHGSDAGLDQQVAALLEDAPDGVDWDVVARVDATAQELR